MMVQPSRVDELARRVESLEASRRALGISTALAWLAVLALGVAVVVTARSPVLRGERLVLGDADGHAWAELGIVDDVPTFVMRDAEGRARIRQIIGPLGPGIGVFAEDDGWQAWLACAESQPWLGFYDGEQHVRAELLVDDAGPRLVLRDEAGDEMERVGRPEDG